MSEKVFLRNMLLLYYTFFTNTFERQFPLHKMCLWSSSDPHFPTFGPDKLRIWALFTQCSILTNLLFFIYQLRSIKDFSIEKQFIGVKIVPDFTPTTPQKTKFSIQVFFSKFDQICRFLRIWSYLLKKFLTKNFIFCAVH